MKVHMKDWFVANKKFDLREYHCQHLYSFGEVIGETEKAYKLSVMAMLGTTEKAVTIWAPKSVCFVK